VLLDTFVVRSIVVPALTFSFGPRIWWPSRLVHEDGGDRRGPGGPDARKPSAAIGNGRAPAKERITGT
jgi:RND superfamily putative drug exporter